MTCYTQNLQNNILQYALLHTEFTKYTHVFDPSSSTPAFVLLHVLFKPSKKTLSFVG